MKHVLKLASLAVMLALPATAETRDSDGDVISVLPIPTYVRDSDGNVISILPYPEIYRDSDGDVISVIYPIDYFRDSDGDVISTISVDEIYEYADDAEIDEALESGPIPDTPAATADRPTLISRDGLIYKVAAPSDLALLKTLERINPIEFELE